MNWLQRWNFYSKKHRLELDLWVRKFFNRIWAFIYELFIPYKKFDQAKRLWEKFLYESSSFDQFLVSFRNLTKEPYNCVWVSDPPNFDFSPISPVTFFARKGDDCDGWSELVYFLVKKKLESSIESWFGAYQFIDLLQIAIYGYESEANPRINFGHMMTVIKLKDRLNDQYINYIFSNEMVYSTGNLIVFDEINKKFADGIETIFKVPENNLCYIYRKVTK